MPSVKNYFANTQTVPVLKTFFMAPLFASRVSRFEGFTLLPLIASALYEPTGG